MTQPSHSCEFTLERKSAYEGVICTYTFIAAQVTIAKCGIKADVHSLMTE